LTENARGDVGGGRGGGGGGGFEQKNNKPNEKHGLLSLVIFRGFRCVSSFDATAPHRKGRMNNTPYLM